MEFIVTYSMENHPTNAVFSLALPPIVSCSLSVKTTSCTNHKAANKVIKCLEHDKSQQQSQAVHHSSYDYEFHKDFSFIDVLFMVKPCRAYTFRFSKTGPRGLHFPRTRVATLSCGIFRFATARLGHSSKSKLLT